jgi:putative PIN family toxin of toxin-antitoxin system
LSGGFPDRPGVAGPLAPPTRVVLDTNVLVGSAYAEWSASRRILNACLRGELIAVLSRALRVEYESILAKAVRVRGYEESFQRLLGRAEAVEPAQTPRVVPDDPEDDKLVAVALAGGAGAIITNDHHLLGLDPYGPVRILRPGEFVRHWLAR